MARRRKLFLGGSSGSKLAQAREALLVKAENHSEFGIIRAKLMAAMSVQQVGEIANRFNLN